MGLRPSQQGTIQQNKGSESELFALKRRRWANVAAVYGFLLLFSILFMGPFMFSLLSSLKDNPTEWPPSLSVKQLHATNWVAAFRLGRQAGGGGLFGGFKPGREIFFETTYRVPASQQPRPPEVSVPRRVPGGRQQLFGWSPGLAIIPRS